MIRLKNPLPAVILLAIASAALGFGGAEAAPASPKPSPSLPSPPTPAPPGAAAAPAVPGRGGATDVTPDPAAEGTREPAADEASVSRNTARTRMRECGHQWSAMKKNGTAAGMTWKEFSQSCLARK